jgi:hypothetical protein
VQFCVVDDKGRKACRNVSTTVEDLVNLRIEMTSPEEAIGTRETTISVDATVTNMEPSGFKGLAAKKVVLWQDPSAHFKVYSFTQKPAGCDIVDDKIQCDISELNVGESIDIGMRLRSKGPVMYSAIDAPLALNVTTATASVEDTYRGLMSVALRPADSDGDGMADDYESLLGFDKQSAADARSDADADGLSNAEEYHLKTDPRDPDTDNDGLIDGQELALGLNPLVRDYDNGNNPKAGALALESVFNLLLME